MGAGQMFRLKRAASARRKDSSYIQAVPIYLASDTAIAEYLGSFTDELDAITGSDIVILWSETVAKKDVRAISAVLARSGHPRFPGLRLTDLPCLWIEDDLNRAAILKLPHKPDEIKQTLRVLADTASETKNTPDLVRLIRERSSVDVRDRSPFLTMLVEDIEMDKAKERLIAAICGVIFVATILVIAIFISSPTPFQYTVFRIVLAIAAAGFAAMTPGFLNVQVGKAIRAGGALAVFVVVFFFAPAALPTAPDRPADPAGVPGAANAS